MTMSGDFSKLQDLAGRLRGLSDSNFLIQVNRQLGEEALTQVRMGFRESRNPYGEPWQPLAYRNGKPLEDTARLRNSFSRGDITAQSFRIDTAVTYARPHQYGAPTRKAIKRPSRGKVGNIPQRMMVPEGARGIGPIWWPAFEKVIDAQRKRVLGR